MSYHDNIYYEKLEESTKNDQIFIPYFRINEAQNLDIVPNFPINKNMNYDQAKMVQAIQNGMIILIKYKGEKDTRSDGGERVIYPMVLGKNKNTGNFLLRGWHVDGYSVKEKRNAKKVWRLFNVSNILSMSFTGNFFRLPPKDYKMNDRVMTEKTIMRADFNQIRRNQNTLIQTGKIEAQEEVKMHTKESVPTIKVKITDQELNLDKPFDNEIIKDQKNTPNNVKISILKTILSNDYISIIDAIGNIGRTVKVVDEKNKQVGIYKVIDAFTGDEFIQKKNIQGQTKFKIYLFEKKK